MLEYIPIRVRYDKSSDVLYIATRPGIPAISQEGSPGVMWRYSVEDGQLVGVTIVDFSQYWRSSQHFPMQCEAACRSKV